MMKINGEKRMCVGAVDKFRRGFTLLEVMVATIILSLGLVALLTAFMQCQRIMRATQGFETAQYVLMLGETLYPLPSPDQVLDDPIENEMLNIEETEALTLLDNLELDDLPKERRDELEYYTFERTVDEIDDEELSRSGYLYTVRTIIRWGRARRSDDRSETTVITLWRKKR
jgi:prepilin-type N-terminal cleavage/methylation domain-containing protein